MYAFNHSVVFLGLRNIHTLTFFNARYGREGAVGPFLYLLDEYKKRIGTDAHALCRFKLQLFSLLSSQNLFYYSIAVIQYSTLYDNLTCLGRINLNSAQVEELNRSLLYGSIGKCDHIRNLSLL